MLDEARLALLAPGLFFRCLSLLIELGIISTGCLFIRWNRMDRS
jgi:hypothetical protein